MILDLEDLEVLNSNLRIASFGREAKERWLSKSICVTAHAQGSKSIPTIEDTQPRAAMYCMGLDCLAEKDKASVCVCLYNIAVRVVVVVGLKPI